MKLYQYKSDGEFFKELNARENPLEKGKYLIPAGCTTKKPPILKKGEVAVFDRSKKSWIMKEDHRQEVFYNKESMQPVKYEKIGAIDLDFLELNTLLEPSQELFVKWDGEKNNWEIDLEEKKEAELNQKIYELKEKTFLESIKNNDIFTTEEKQKIQEKISNLEVSKK